MPTHDHLILGAGPTGLATARLLADAGASVMLVSRRGGTPSHPRIRHVAQDATDGAALAALAAGAQTIFDCAMPRYDRWPQEFPPIAAAAVQAAQRSGASLITLSNVYGYGAPAGDFVESLPMAPISVKGRVRAQMWEDALASGLRVAEVRASDYLGAGAASLFTLLVLPSLLRGEAAMFPGDIELPHSWSYTVDVARTLVAASRVTGPWGRAWHVPSTTASVRALAEQATALAQVAPAQLSRMPGALLAQLAEADSITREVVEMTYLFEQPRLLNADATEAALGVSTTPLEAVLRDTLAGLSGLSDAAP